MNLLDRIKGWIAIVWIYLLDLKDWHEYKVEDYVQRFNISLYGGMWIAFTKGVLTVLLIQWLI